MQSSGWDFDKRNTSNSYNANTYLNFKNYWEIGSGASYETNSLSNADLRGGPAFLYPGNFNYWLYVSTDNRKKIQVAINPYWTWGMESYSRSSGLDIDFIYRPINSLNITISPSISRSQNELQYVTTASVNNNYRYLVANVDQTVARISLRMTYMITPNLSLQYWGQPFGAAGTYSNFKYIADARAFDYSERFTNVSPDLIALNDDGQYSIDENKDGAAEVVFDKPDFNFGQFRSNAVIRWEYIPGSTLFLVWTHERNGSFYDRSDPLHEKYSFDFSQQRAHPVFLIKYTYRFVL